MTSKETVVLQVVNMHVLISFLLIFFSSQRAITHYFMIICADTSLCLFISALHRIRKVLYIWYILNVMNKVNE